MSFILKPSPNYNERNGQVPFVIIIHYTGMKTEEEALERLCDSESEVSTHYTINQRGDIYQHVETDKRAWHAGQSSWKGCDDVNSISIGIELVNKGHEFGYEEFADEQIKALVMLCSDIQSKYPIKHVLAHSDVAPTRKEDPGEKFPWQYLAKQGVGIWPEHEGNNQNLDSEISIKAMLSLIGYDVNDENAALLAFQRHYVPEVFMDSKQEKKAEITKARLRALAHIS